MPADLTAIRALLASVDGFTPGPYVPSEATGYDLTDPGDIATYIGNHGPTGVDFHAWQRIVSSAIRTAPTLHAHLTELVGEVERLRTRARHADNVLAAIDVIRAFGEDPADCAARLVSNLLEIKSACHGRPGEHPIAAFRRALAVGEAGFDADLADEVARLRAHNARMVAHLIKDAERHEQILREAPWDGRRQDKAAALRALAAGEVGDV